MGYGDHAYRTTHITYKDIAGVSITRGFHTDDHHLWMFRENKNETTNEVDSVDVICALCNGVRYDVNIEDEEYASLYEERYIYKSCNHHQGTNEEMILVATDGERNFFKCRYCRYIKEVDMKNGGTVTQYVGISLAKTVSASNEKYYKLNVSDVETYEFNASNGSGLEIKLCDSNFNEMTDLSTSVFNTNGYSTSLLEGTYYLYVKNNTTVDATLNITISPPHTHDFSEWAAVSPTMHSPKCSECGSLEMDTAVHVVKETTARFAPCLVCGYLVDLDKFMAQTPILKITQVTINGPYILPNGIIVLVDEDIEAYENGTLVFYDKDKLPQTQ